MNIQWYPGHMAKTKRKMAESLKLVDLVCEIVDARIPLSSRNPDLDGIVGGKPRLLVLNRIDLADLEITRQWADWFCAQGYTTLSVNSQSGQGMERFVAAAERSVRDLREQWKSKGQGGRSIRVMVVGIPNVGKSTFINRLLKRKAAGAADRPGVTRGQQWFRLENGMELLDTPGILWPKLEDPQTGLFLAATGAIKDEIMDRETLACHLMEMLWRAVPDRLTQRYRLHPERLPQESDFLGYELLMQAARGRGFLLPGNETDTERMARILLDEFRGGVLGRISLERPDEIDETER